MTIKLKIHDGKKVLDVFGIGVFSWTKTTYLMTDNSVYSADQKGNVKKLEYLGEGKIIKEKKHGKRK